MGPGEVAGAAPKGKRENSQAKGSDPDETPERKGKTALDAEGATAEGAGISQAKNGGARYIGVLCVFFHVNGIQERANQ